MEIQRSAGTAPVLEENIPFNPNSGGSGDNKPVHQRRIRLRRVESGEPKRFNVKAFRRLSIFQGMTAGAILFWEVISYAIATRYYKILELTGIGLWGPLLFFSVASFLTRVVTTRKSSRCIIGTALGFQIISVIVGIIMTIFAAISITYYGRWDSSRGHGNGFYDPEVAGRVFCSLILLGSILATLIALGTSVMLCRLERCCCAETNVHTLDDEVMYEVEEVKP